HYGAFDRLGGALPQVGCHRVSSISQKGHTALTPGAHRLAVHDVTTEDRLFVGRGEEALHRFGPPFVRLQKHRLWSTRRILTPFRSVEDRRPVVPPPAYREEKEPGSGPSDLPERVRQRRREGIHLLRADDSEPQR